VRVEVAGAHDWAAWKQLRLEALQDTPVAFCQRYEDAVQVPDAAWQEELGAGFHVLAWEQDQPVAMAQGWVDERGAGLGAVYVTPVRRGEGLLDALVEQVVSWAREQGAPQLRLLVHETNRPAARAYERLGFRVTGHREPYPLGPGDEVEMALPL
jgi:GNAT superfamily N-acetyltransferase